MNLLKARSKVEKSWRRWALPVAVAAMAGMAACEKGAGDEPDKEEEPAIPVEVSTPVRGDILAVYSGTAPIEAFADAEVIAKVAGEVRKVYVEEGDEVTAGQILLQLDGDRLRYEAQQAEANLRKLQRDFQRNSDLRKRNLISAGDFEKIQFEMEALEATFKLATLELGYTEVRAPIDGVISQRYVKLGNTIEANTPVFQVTSLEPLVSYLHVPEREYRRIKPGQTASISVDAIGKMLFEGTVARISPIVDHLTGTFKITVEVRDATRRLKPGMFGRISIVYDRHVNALQIPRNAIVGQGGESAVFVVNDGLAHRRVVQTGYVEGGQIEITDGLSDDETFVLVGQNGLREGSKVSVINGDSVEPVGSDSLSPR
ncbi:MAG: efflux RND transporter periplasmic adaptor subunit [Woeseia sp.]